MSSSQQGEPIHSYDGIQEYDNPLPGWWKWLFVGTFFFSLVYVMFYHIGAPKDRNIKSAYEAAFAQNLVQQFSEIGELQPDRPTLLKYVNDQRWLKVGESVFKQHCVSCHGAEGGGLVGPNLHDEYWKNVKRIEDIGTVLTEGAGKGAMPAWKTRLHPNELTLVSAYVAAMRNGPPPAKAKAPEGNAVGKWDEGEPAAAPASTGSSTPSAASSAAAK